MLSSTKFTPLVALLASSLPITEVFVISISEAILAYINVQLSSNALFRFFLKRNQSTPFMRKFPKSTLLNCSNKTKKHVS